MEEFTISPRSKNKEKHIQYFLVGSKESWLAGNLKEFEPGNGQVNRPGCILEGPKIQTTMCYQCFQVGFVPKKVQNGTTNI